MTTDNTVVQKALQSLETKLFQWQEEGKFNSDARSRAFCLMLPFLIGRTKFKFANLSAVAKQYYKEYEFGDSGKKIFIYDQDLKLIGKAKWQKDLYFDHFLPLIHLIDDDWPDQDENWVAQLNAMIGGGYDKILAHTDPDDVCPQYAIGLGDYTGGLVQTWKGDIESVPKVSVKQDIKHKVVKLDGCFPHQTTPFTGKRSSLYFCKNYDSRYVTSPTVFPPKVVYDFPAWPTTLEQSVTLLPKKQRRKRKAKRREHDINKTDNGGFVDLQGRETVSGAKRSCMQDAALNAAKQLGICIDRTMLYDQLPARTTVNRTLHELFSASCIQSTLNFLPLDKFHGRSGGPEFNLLKLIHSGVYFVLARVEAKTHENHAFVHDAGFHDETHPLAVGAIICNRKSSPVRMLEDADRNCVQSAREALNSFYSGNIVRVLNVYEVVADGSKVVNNIELCRCEKRTNSKYN
jgi:hypothetical protein